MPHREQELLLSQADGNRGVKGVTLLHLVSCLEALHSPCGVHDAPLPGEEGMTLAAKLHLEHRLCRADSEGVAARADNLCFHVFRMDILLHGL